MSAAETSLLAAAAGGDEHAFVELTSPHRTALHVHCYRMLGSLFDADDALQETMLRAWRGLDGFEPRAPLRTWLYRIATNVCLRLLEQRERHAAVGIDAHVEPYPDQLLEQLPSPGPGPDVAAEMRENIGLAFITALQLLPAKQRATLVFRDALGWSAREVAELLDDSVAAVNSALQRARERLERERREGTLTRQHAPRDDRTEATLMQRFHDAWADVDVDGLVALLADDSLLTMPPEAGRFAGREAISAFFATAPMDGRLDLIRLVPARLNRQPALVGYAQDPADGVFRGYGVMAFAVAGERIAGIVGFPYRPHFFERLGFPIELDR